MKYLEEQKQKYSQKFETSALEEACGVTEEMKKDSVTEQETNNPERI